MSSTTKTRVLLADDEKHIRQLVKTILMPLNAEVVGEAINGAEAVKLFQELHPDIVLLDINMPVLDGTGALARIIELDPNAVVIMLTSMADLATVQKTIELGASQYIRKDTSALEIRDILKQTFQQYLPGPQP